MGSNLFLSCFELYLSTVFLLLFWPCVPLTFSSQCRFCFCCLFTFEHLVFGTRRRCSSPCLLPAPVLGSTLSPRGPGSFCGRVVLDTKIQARASEVFLTCYVCLSSNHPNTDVITARAPDPSASLSGWPLSKARRLHALVSAERMHCKRELCARERKYSVSTEWQSFEKVPSLISCSWSSLPLHEFLILFSAWFEQAWGLCASGTMRPRFSLEVGMLEMEGIIQLGLLVLPDSRCHVGRPSSPS